MKNILLLTALALGLNAYVTGQCTVNTSASPTEIVCGESVVLSAFGSSTGQLVLDEDFNTGGFGPGWSSTPGATSFSNPCSPGGVDGTTHAWMDNNTSVPRALTSANYDLSAATAGVTICFDLLFAEQGNAAPCEGPDEPDEGVFLQYSTDGGTTWIDIYYFDPNGGNDPQLTNWNNWCFPVPAGGITSNTMFQWYQEADSGADYDHWGIDNVQIFMNDINSELVWLHDNYSYGVGNAGGPNPTPVTPTTTTTYTAEMTTGTGAICTQDITVIVTPPIFDVNLTASPTTICAGDCSSISGTAEVIQDPGGIETYENNEFQLVASGSSSVNINVQGINTNSIYSGLIQNVTINGFSFSGSSVCTNFFGGCDCNGVNIAFGATCTLGSESFTVTLTAPGGCTIILAPSGVATGNYNNTVFVPVGGTAFGPGFPNGGTWDPQEPFSNLNGCDPNGVWTLSFDAPGLGFGFGTLFGWSITFDDPPIYQPVCTSWSPTTNLTNPASVNTDACPTTSTDYTLTVSNCIPGCPTYDEVVSIIVDPCGGCTPPNLIITPLQACAPNTVDLSTAIGVGSDPANLTYYNTQLDAQNATNPIGSVVSTSGSYWVRAEDPTDPTCFLEYEIVVVINDLSYSSSVVNETCGAGDGQISLTALLGVGPYTYSINGGATTQGTGTFIDLASGPYNILITDITTGCTIAGTENVSNLGGPVIDNIVSIDPTCPGSCDGSITVTVSGGTAPYTYQWFDGALNPIGTNAATINGLCDGNYSVEVSDATGGTAQLFYDDFETGAAGWNLNVSVAPEGADPNYFEVDDDEGGVVVGGCGIAGNGNATLHITSVFFPGGGAAYDAGGLCGLLFCPETHRRAESPMINTVGQTGLTLNFDFIAQGDIPNDQATVWFDDGGGWTQLGGPLFSGTGACNPQGIWTAYSAALPASCENIPNLRVAIRWDNNDDGAGTDPSVAINNIEIVTSGAATCTTTQFASLTDPAPEDPSFTLTDFCEGAVNGATGIVLPGGTFVYNPNPGDGSSVNVSTGEITNGVAGTTYTIEYTTNGLCPESTINTVTVNGFTYNALITDENCGSSDGQIDLTTVGGSPTFTYSVDNGATSQAGGLFTGLAAGNYNVLITDNNGCQATGIETVSNIGGPTITSITPTDPICATACDGEIIVVVSGGAAPYSYQWYDAIGTAIGPNSATITGLCAGDYSVDVTDAGGVCVVNALATLVDPLAEDPSFTLTDFCQGNANAASGIVTPGGTFAYNPNPGDGSSVNATTGEITNGVVGSTYTIEYTTPGACPQSTANTVIVNGFTYNATITDETCGAADGSIDLITIGGSPTFTYSIDNGVTTQANGLFAGLTSGNYNIVITDNNGCQATGLEVVSNTSGPTISSITPTDPTCPTACDGEITITVTGGTPPYSYQWFDGLGTPIGPNAATITGLCEDNYSVQVTDASGGGSTQLNTNSDFETGTGGGCDCPPGFTCNNDAGQVFDGMMPVYAPGSQGCVTGATNYTNSLGANSGTGYVYFYAGADNISAGPYTFLGGETVELCVWYAGPQGAGASGQNTANSHFSFGMDGVQIGPDVPVPTNTGWTQYCFTVVMTPGNHTFQILSGGAAQYALWFDDFTITDQSGGGGASCPATSNTSLVDPTPADPTFVLTDFCEGATNSATGIVTPGGTFAYNPNPADGSTVDPATGEIANGIIGTTYTIEYTTPGTCPETMTNTVTVNGVGYTVSITDENCGLADGEIDLTTVGGSPAFTYSIDNGVTTQAGGLFTGLTSGNYDVLITDNNGCQVIGTETVSNIGGPTITSITPTDPTCALACDGEITVVISGGTLPYTFQWYDAVGTAIGPNAATIAGLCAGDYSVEVTDAIGTCMDVDMTSLIDPIAADPTFTLTDFCAGEANAASGIVTPGGTFAYNPNPADGSTVNAATGEITNGLAGTTYTIEYTVGGACPVTLTNDVTVNGFTYNAAITDENCGLADGEIDLSTVGGAPAFTYSIDNGVTTQAGGLFTGLSVGNYDVLIVDNNGCQATGIENVSNIGGPSIDNAVILDESCSGDNDGSIDVNAVSGGSGVYNYSWDIVPDPAVATVNGLAPGTYTLTLTDPANGCIDVATYTVNAGPICCDLVIDTISTTPATCGNANGEIVATAIGGDGNYTYSINNAPFVVSGIFQNLSSGAYQVIVNDGSGVCADTIDVIIDELLAPTIDAIATVDVNCNLGSDGEVTITASGGTGLITYDIDNGAGFVSTNNTGLFVGVPAGSYTITITDDNGCQNTDVFDILEPTAVTVVVDRTDILCFGTLTGEISITANGGTPGYSYSIDNGTTWSPTTDFTGLAAGVYNVIVEDANGCQSVMVVSVITEPAQLSVNVGSTNETCFEDCNGSITWAPIGGTGPFVFDYNGTIASSQAINNLCPAVYNYNLTDANGCVVSGSVDIIAAPEIIPGEITVVNDGCDDGCDGSISLSSNSGVSYTIGGITNATGVFNGVCSGNYSILITDANGCTVTTGAIVTEAEPTEAMFAYSPGYVTVLDNEVQLINTSYNADEYLWEITGYNNGFSDSYSGDLTSYQFPADSGSYLICLTAINNEGCEDTYCAPIVVQEVFTLYVPNAFTPDDDEFNQNFMAYVNGIDIYEYEMLIFNRWGEIVWENHDPSVGWDGTYHGKLVQDGVYTWKISVKFPYNDERQSFVGHVSILR